MTTSLNGDDTIKQSTNLALLPIGVIVVRRPSYQHKITNKYLTARFKVLFLNQIFINYFMYLELYH